MPAVQQKKRLKKLKREVKNSIVLKNNVIVISNEDSKGRVSLPAGSKGTPLVQAGNLVLHFESKNKIPRRFSEWALIK